MGFDKLLSDCADTELIQMLEAVSGEIKRRSDLMITGNESREEMVQKIVKMMFPKVEDPKP